MPTSTATMATRDSDLDVGELAAQLRVDSIRAAAGAGSGHVTSSLSAADLMAVLMRDHLRYDWTHPDNPNNDHLIFSKGHASPLLYAMFRAAGVLETGELTKTYRQHGSRLEGHPTPRLPWVDVATGSLGQGLPIAAGMALASKELSGRPGRIWVLCGDSEMSEGSVWEAFDMIGRHHLDNITVIVDINRLGQSGPTSLEWDLDTYARRVEAFGTVPYAFDGHNEDAIANAYTFAADAGAPTVLLARTIKGRGVPEVEDQDGWHGKPLPAEMTVKAVQGLGGERNLHVPGHRPFISENGATDSGAGFDASEPETAAPDGRAASSTDLPDLPHYEQGDEVATRAAYGAALVALGRRPEIVALDGEVANSTHAADFAKEYPERFFQSYIAECQMIATAVGLAKSGYKPFASTFAAFTSRAYDFIRMAAISQANFVLCGSHAGVEIGADGPSQMALEDIAALRAIHSSTVLYPSDATSCTALVAAAADRDGIVYLRTTRGSYPVLYGADEEFPIGGSKQFGEAQQPDLTIIAAGVTVHTALEAAQRLADRDIHALVIDAYSIKPLDAVSIRAAVTESAGRVIVVEDHRPEGGLCSAVLESLADSPEGVSISVESLAVRTMPGSATASEQLADAGLDADAIVAAARRVIGRRPAG